MILSLEQILNIEKKFCSPFYLFDEKGFVDNFNALQDSFRRIYPWYQIAYSYKTNYTPYIVSLVKSLGGLAEVVSDMEYKLAKHIGYDDKHIIYNGPCKGSEGVDAFLNGTHVHIDNLQELKKLCLVAVQHPNQSFTFGIRINVDVGQGFTSRFGIDVEQLSQAVNMVNQVANLQIDGIHCHISRCRNLEAWRKRAEVMSSIADKYFSGQLSYIDLGSGMYGSMEFSLKEQFDDVPSFADYASVVAGLFAEYFSGDYHPWLITEPGTTLVNRFVECYAKVETVKRVHGKVFAVLNNSFHILGETCVLKSLPMQIIHCGKRLEYYKDVDFVGYTCLEQDVMSRNYSGTLSVGDYVRFGNVGGYSNVLKPPFIRPNCAMLVSTLGGKIEMIKRAETFEDIFQTYVM